MITLVQSTAGGFLNTTGSGNGLVNLTSSAVGFASPTTAGNLLVAVVWVRSKITSGGIFMHHSEHGAIATPGLSWATSSDAGWGGDSGLSEGTLTMFAVQNAPSIAPSALTTVIGVFQGGTAGTNYNAQIEFNLYEFAGVATSFSLERSIGNLGASSTVDAGTISPISNDDLILVSWMGQDSDPNLTVGSGYTLGINATVAIRGQPNITSMLE